MSSYVAKMTGLQASTTYKYRIGDGSTNWSEELTFTTAPDASTLEKTLPHRFLVFGDLASSASLPDRTSTIMPWASQEAMSGHFDMILHVGDFAYNLNDDNGGRGRLFMNEIANMSSIVPYMVDAGNHESGYAFAHYTEYFRSQPSNEAIVNVSTDNGVAPNNWFFSWNYGLVHFVTLDSEIYYHDEYSDVLASQYEWLKADLETANVREYCIILLPLQLILTNYLLAFYVHVHQYCSG